MIPSGELEWCTLVIQISDQERAAGLISKATGRDKLRLGVLVALVGLPIPLAFAGGLSGESARFESINQPMPAQAFDSINFPIEAVPGVIQLRAQAGWVWREGNTHRIILEQDVDVTLGDHQFIASQAGLWLRKLSADIDAGTSRYQVYAIFEDLRSADGSMVIDAQQLPVRGVIELSSSITMHLDTRFDSPPASKTPGGRFHQRANALYAQRVLGIAQEQSQQDEEVQAALRPWSSPEYTSVRVEDQEPGTSNTVAGSSTQPRGPIFHPDGVFSISIGGRIVIDGASSDQGSVITADGGVMIQYQNPGNREWVDFKAERVVLFASGKEPIDGVSRLGTNQIEGIYLEGGVFAGDDQWAVRSPRMYLDVANNKALMLDAVFWTTDLRTKMPLYLRAQSVRQTAKNEFQATKAKISNSAFFAPDLTIGVSDIKVTIDESQGLEGIQEPAGVHVEGKHATLNIGPVPVLWVPGFKGDVGSFPLRRITVTDSSRSGLELRSRWNALSLLKIDAPPGVEVDFDLDYYAERGFGIGSASQWNTAQHSGGLFSYMLLDDEGTDYSISGKRIAQDGGGRGIFSLHDVWEFTNEWTLITEMNYISDETFVPAMFSQLPRTTERFDNRFQFERRGDQSHFAIELSAVLNDFIVPEHQLQTPGYQVSKLPEARFISLGKDLLPEQAPGLLTYSFEARAGMMRLAFSEVNAEDYGFTSNTLANDAFGTTPGTSLGDRFRSIGLDESAVARVDTRHEITARLNLGPIRITPFVAARITAYDDSFDAYSPGQDDDIRLWGSGGVTLSTTFSKVNNQAQSQFFDIHRLRHIVEPSITIWGGDSNFETDDVPIFDDDVEGLLTGTAFRAAIDQTWQTKRGGVGRWYDADVFKLKTEYVWTSDDAGQSPIPEFFTARPELSNPGEHLRSSIIWKPTEVLAFASEVLYDFKTNETARTSVGVILEHRTGFATTVEYRQVQPLDATFASLGTRYRLTDKYALSTSLNYNFHLNDFQTFNAQLLRRFQIGSMGMTVRYDNIRGETSFGIIFRPAGSAGGIPIDNAWGG